MEPKLPTFDKLMNPLLRALGALGGSGSVEEIYNKVVELERFSDEVLAQLHDPENSNNTEVWYRLAWARTYLKKYGLLDNSKRGVWTLTAKARAVDKVDPQEVVRTVRAQDKKEAETKSAEQPEPEVPEEKAWKRTLHSVLTQKLSPAAFEKLVQRVLRESGFTQVEVTGRTGDGGIDGRGIARIHGLMSFHVLFQCKRYKGSVSAGEIRDFRGAMVGRADKGLFISTGTFSPAAVKEASRSTLVRGSRHWAAGFQDQAHCRLGP
jgi:restriction system protein